MRYRYFFDRHGISVFASFCYGIAVLGTPPPPKCPPPRGALTKCQCVWLRRTLRCPSCLQVGITVGMIPPSCILFGINYCTRENDPPPPLAPPSPPLTSQIYARLGPAVGGDGWGASAINGQHSQQLTLLCNSVICYEYTPRQDS